MFSWKQVDNAWMGTSPTCPGWVKVEFDEEFGKFMWTGLLDGSSVTGHEITDIVAKTVATKWLEAHGYKVFDGFIN